MDIAELADSIRHAEALADFSPGAPLTKALASFLFVASKELQGRGKAES